MSCYNWERGTITLPSKEWSKFRTELLKAWNGKLLETFDLAKKAHKAAKDAGKGKRGKNRKDAMLAAIARVCGGRISDWGDFEVRSSRSMYGSSRSDVAYENWENVTRLLGYDRWSRNDSWKLQAPKKKDLGLVATSKSCTIQMPEASATFNNDNRSVTWSVPENNRAVEAANDHWFAKKLWAALGRVTWTRGTGGKIIGNDEYNRDSDYEGGGGNYVTKEFRKLTKAEERAKAAARRNSYRSYGYARW